MTNTSYTEIIKQLFGESLPKATLSNPTDKKEPAGKITVMPVTVAGATVFQFSSFVLDKVFHENLDAAASSDRLAELLPKYRLCDIYAGEYNYKFLSNGKNSKMLKKKTEHSVNGPIAHNREKNYIMNEGRPVEWLVKLGVTDEKGRVFSHYAKKFRQLNRYLEMIDDIAEFIPENAEIVDFGCGKAYLTFALYYYFNILKNKNVNITGLDLKKDVVAECGALAEKLGFYRLRFFCGDIADYAHDKPKINMVVSLHACDTATDYAIYNAVGRGADVILAVPCCQHELFSQVKHSGLTPLLSHGILKEKYASLLTDGIRAAVLEISGYKTDVLEFIDMEHTPKNIMIRAVRKSRKGDVKLKKEALEALLKANNVSQKLHDLMKNEYTEDEHE